MQLHEIKPIHKGKTKKRIGRGGRKGTYCGRGMKGQTSRAGAKVRPAWRDLLKQIPKLRGVKFKSIYKKTEVINISTLDKNFKDGEKINPTILAEKRLVARYKGKAPAVKILGMGETKKKFAIEDCAMSESVKKKLS